MDNRYRRVKDLPNELCLSCHRAIWIRNGTYKIKGGFKAHKNTKGAIESYTLLSDNNEIIAYICPQCFNLKRDNYAH